MSLLSPVRIKGRLAVKLNHLSFRRRFFRLRAQEETAQQIRELRDRRGLRQVDLAKRAKMRQSAVSRIEQAGYSAWTYKTLLRVAEALDAQLRIVFEPSEDVIARYQREEADSALAANPEPYARWVRYRNDSAFPTFQQHASFSDQEELPTVDQLFKRFTDRRVVDGLNSAPQSRESEWGAFV